MANQIQQWQIAHASVRGKSHIDAGLPNQDALHLAVSQDQTCFSLVMCDGAGSARFAQEGARHFSRCIGERLLALVLNANENGLTDKHRNQVGDQIVQIIATARQELDLRGATLRDYACNLMAVAMGPQWGLRVHLGDAVLIKCRFAIQPDQGVDYFADTQMTVQDRSEYANETHFLTQHDWTRHLIWDFLDPSGPEDMYALMTDGAADIALANTPNSTERRVFRGFLAPLVAQVLHAEPQERDQAIHDALASPLTFRITGDDKTLALVMRKRCWNHQNVAPVLQSQSDPLPQGPATTPIPPPSIKPSPTSSTAPEPIKSSNPATPRTPPTTNRSTGPAPLSVLSSKQPHGARASLMGMALLGLCVGLAAWPAYQAASAHWSPPQTPAQPTPPHSKQGLASPTLADGRPASAPAPTSPPAAATESGTANMPAEPKQAPPTDSDKSACPQTVTPQAKAPPSAKGK